jgi:hypothetical protein
MGYTDPDYKRKWRAENRERLRQQQRAYYAQPAIREREHRRKASAEYRAKNREQALRRKYKLTVIQREAMSVEQGGVCAICHRPESMMVKGEVSPLAVDHNHRTGKVRGLLCVACNQGLGRFQDNIDRLLSAAAYLRRTDGAT